MRLRPCVLLLCLLLLLAPCWAAAQSSRSRGAQKSQGQLLSELERLRRERERLNRALRSTQKKTRQVKADLRQVDTRLVRVENLLQETETSLDRRRDEQKRVAAELAALSDSLEKARAQVGARLKTIYMRGPASTLTAFVGTRSTGDLASRGYLLQAIAKKDRKVFESYGRLRGMVAARKRRTDELVREISSLLDRQRRRQVDLREARREKGQYLSELQQKQGWLQEQLRQLEADERTIEDQIQAFARARGSSLPTFTGRFSRPVPGGISSGYGMRYHPILRVRRMHKGVDFRGNSGTPIRCAAPGEVIAAQYMRGYGNTVIVDHGGGISTVYAHCSRVMVSAGQKVARGQVIAAVGSTGLATAPHLHWEVRVNGRAVNPLGRL